MSHSRITVRTVEAFQTTAAIDTVDGAIATIHAAHAARLDTDAIIAQDDPTAPSSIRYANVFAVRDADRSNPILAKLAALFHRPEVLAAFTRSKGNDTALVRISAPELQAIELRLRSEVPG